jgi:hypothetical protein
MRITITFTTDSDAFTEDFVGALTDAFSNARSVLCGFTGEDDDPVLAEGDRVVQDWNGNTIGTVTITE